jgi:cytochrome P450
MPPHRNGLSARDKLEGGPQALFELIKQNNFQNFDLQFPFMAPLVIVMDERDRTFMLKDNWTNFVKNVDGAGLAECLFPLFGKSFFVSDGARWRHGRKSALHMFNAKSLRLRTEVVVPEMTQKLVEVRIVSSVCVV